MLQALRDKSSGWIATIILGLLIIPFAFFGMEQYLFQSSNNFAAKLEAPPTWWRTAPDWWPVRKLVWQKEEITLGEFRTAFDEARLRQQQMAGSNFDARQFESADNKRKVLDSLIDTRVMQLATEREGFAIGDTLVKQTIESDPGFQVDGKFDIERYRVALASAVPAMTPKQYDERIRSGLRQQWLADRLRRSAFITPAETQRLLKMAVETRDVSFATIPTPAQDTTAIPAADIARWYKDYPDDFRSPEMISVEYIEVNSSALPPPPAPDEATLRLQYEAEKKRFVEPEQRLTSHVLVKMDAKADAAAQKAAEAKANDLLKQAKAGADFAALARNHSEDPGSRESGGDLGWISRGGGMVKPFEDGVFATATGAISGPVKSEFGWHIIKVREIKPEKGIPFEQARPELERSAVQTAREAAYNALTGKLVDEVIKSPSTLAPAAKAVGLSLLKAGPFSREQASGVLASPAVLRSVFSDTMTQQRMASDLIEVADGQSMLIRVIEHTPARVRPLSEVGTQVVAAIRADRARKAMEADADAIISAVNKGESLAKLAAARKLVLTNVPGVPRGAPVPSPEATEAYFTVSAPATGKQSAGKVILLDGQVLAFAVTKINEGNVTEIPAEQRGGFLEQQAQRIGSEDASLLNKQLRTGMKVTVFESQL